MIRRLTDYRGTFGDDDPAVYILSPSPSRPVPAGDTRRGTAWIFRKRAAADRFARWIEERHGLSAVPLGVPLRQIVAALSEKDLTWVLDPEPQPGYGTPFSFKAPLAH